MPDPPETEATLKEQKDLRKVERGKLTTRINKVKDVYAQDSEADKDELAYQMYLAEKQASVLREIDEKLTRHGAPKESRYEDELEEVLFKANRLLSRLDRDSGTKDESEHSEASSSESVKIRAKLPQLELPKFDGKIEEFSEFWGTFSDTVDNTDLPDGTKMAYLVSLLSGEALTVVKGLTVTAKNYPAAVKRLKDNFDRKDLAIQQHWTALHALKPSTDKPGDNKRLRNEIEIHLSSLEALGALGEEEMMGSFLCQSLIAKFPVPIIERWSDESPEEDRLQHLRTFLKKAVDRRENALLLKEATSSHSPSEEKDKTGSMKKLSTAAALKTEETTKSKRKTQEFFKGKRRLEDFPVAERIDEANRRQICYNCLIRGHSLRSCKKAATCSTCQKKHHNILHEAFVLAEKEGNEKSRDMSVVSAAWETTNMEAVVMESMLILASGPKGSAKVRVFFDTGASRSYVHQSVAKELGLTSLEERKFCTRVFGGGQTETTRSLVELGLRPLHGGGDEVKVRLWTAEKITQPLAPVQIPPWVQKRIEGLGCSENYCSPDPKCVQVLLGTDVYWTIVQGEMTRLANGLVVKHSKLGSFLHGKIGQCVSQENEDVHLLIEQEVEMSWSLEGVGVHRKEVEEFVLQPPQRDGDRFMVQLPWKNELRPLPNVELAEKRLENTVRRMDDESKQKYEAYLNDMLIKGYIVPVEKTNSFYLPHRGVWRGDKLRVVYDGSAKGVKGTPSINQLLHTGPNMLPKLVMVLMRFRLGEVGLQGDIREAFLQLKVKEEDCGFLKILWTNGRAFEFRRLLFGLNCAPYLLNVSVAELYKEYQDVYPETIQCLQQSTYVDDLLPSVGDEALGRKIQREGVELFQSAGMELKHWLSNRETLDSTVESSPITKVLGVGWNRRTDVLICSTTPKWSPETPVTRRTVLVAVASIFDPLGILCPWILRGRSLFQETWTLKLSWDAELPEESQVRFRDWAREGLEFQEYKFPRWIEMSGGDCCEIHVFTDASKLAFAAVVYLVYRKYGCCRSALVFARTRLAPLKPKLSIRRLELMGAWIGARAYQLCKEALPQSDNVFFWTDSQVVRYWVKAGSASLKTFESNRVKEIEESCVNWNYVPSELNPADLATRGCFLNEFPKLWWKGPPFLLSGEWPKDPGLDAALHEVVQAAHDEPPDLLEEPVELPFEFKIPIRKTRRVLAWVFRFIDALKKRIKTGDLGNSRSDQGEVELPVLSAEGIRKANDCLIRMGQMEEFGKEYKVLKEGKLLSQTSRLSRLHCVFDQQRELIMIVPRYDPNLRLPLVSAGSRMFKWMVQETHERILHGGVGSTTVELLSRCHVLKARSAVKKALRITCFSCRRTRGRPFKSREARLPEFRTKPCRPFEHTGLDYMGPLVLKNGDKVYVLLLTCAVVRGVHLELTPSLDSDSTDQALRRFMARRGTPKFLYSDNALSFVKISRNMRWEEVEWKMIPPHAPWWGGFYERLVALIKASIKSTLLHARLDFLELQTVLAEVEEAVNRRPLTALKNEDEGVLTPAHFLMGSAPNDAVLPEDMTPSFVKAWKNKRALANQCWAQFQREYLLRLRQWKDPEGTFVREPKVGDLVLIENKGKNPLTWEIGRVLERGSHSCRLMTGQHRNVVSRAWECLYPLEASEEEAPIIVEKVDIAPRRPSEVDELPIIV